MKITLFFLLFASYGLNAQFHASFGVGIGNSSHADSYIVEKDYKIFEYSGFRAFVAEGRVDYTFASETALYAGYRFSPNVSTISPYKYTYSFVGLEQVIPKSTFYVTGAYGKNNSSASVKLAKGNLLLLGIGIKSYMTRLQLSYLTGKMQNEVVFLRPNERRLTLTLHFSTL